STVGTTTEIHDYLRLLYARVGTPYCPTHELPLQMHNVSQMVDELLSWPAESRVAILAPVALFPEQSLQDSLRSLQTQGFIRVRLNGEMLAIDELTMEDLPSTAELEVVIDRLRIRPDSAQRLAESFETALATSEGRALVINLDEDRS